MAIANGVRCLIAIRGTRIARHRGSQGYNQEEQSSLDPVEDRKGKDALLCKSQAILRGTKKDRRRGIYCLKQLILCRWILRGYSLGTTAISSESIGIRQNGYLAIELSQVTSEVRGKVTIGIAQS